MVCLKNDCVLKQLVFNQLIKLTIFQRNLQFSVFRLNNLINLAFVGKNMQFGSVTSIKSPRNLNDGSISIYKKSFKPFEIKEEVENDRKVISLAHILPNGQVCVANEKLPQKLPRKIEHAQHFIDVVNSYIMFMNHKNHGAKTIFKYL